MPTPAARQGYARARTLAAALGAPAYPTRPPLDWRLEDAQAAVAYACTADGQLDAEAYAANAAYVERKDHWQRGDGWIGTAGNGAVALTARALQMIYTQFTPVDAIGEAVRRAATALTKHPAALDVVPTSAPPAAPAGTPAPADPASDTDQDGRPDPDARALAQRTALQDWARRVKLRQATGTVARRARTFTRGIYRVWMPAGRLVAQDRVDAETRQVVRDAAGQPVRERVLPANLTLPDALAHLELSTPAPDTAAVFTDEATRAPVGVFLCELPDGRGNLVAAAEVWAVDAETGETVLRLLRDAPAGSRRGRRGAAGDALAAAAELVSETRYPIGGLLPLVQVDGELLVTDPVRRQQAQCNFFNTLLTRVGEVAGFPERYIANAEPSGQWSEVRIPGAEILDTRQTVEGEGEDRITRTWYLYAAPRTLGASVTTELTGLESTDDLPAGGTRTTRLTPSVTFREPTDPEYLTKAVRHARAMVLLACHQGHVVETDVAQRSGISIDQSRADFADDAEAQAEPHEAGLGAVATVALAWAGLMTRPADRPDVVTPRTPNARYRVSVQLRVDPGPRSADQQRADGEDVAAGRLSLRTKLQRDRIPDVDAELRAIRADPLQRARASEAQATAAAAWTGAGAGLEGAAAVVGVSVADRATLRTNAGVAPGVDDPEP